MLHRWITTDPVVNHVWEQDRQPGFAEVARKYMAYINGEEPTEPYLILYGERPIGYIQTYLWRDYPEYGAYLDLSGAASLDLFIGEPAYRGRGLGEGLLRRFLREYVFVRPEVTSCVITPEMGNTPAVRAYEKAGFRHVRTVPGIAGEPGPVYFMRLERPGTTGTAGAQSG